MEARAVAVLLRIEPDPVVTHREPDGPVAFGQLDDDIGCMGVLRDVLQRFEA